MDMEISGIEQICREYYEDETIKLNDFIDKFCLWLAEKKQDEGNKEKPIEIYCLIERILYAA